MNTLKTTALSIACAGVAIAAANCTGAIGTSTSAPSTTDITVRWLFAGQPGSADTCSAHKGEKVVVTMSGTIAASLHQSVTQDCATGSVTFPKLDLVDLGMPYIELTLLDDKDGGVATAGELVAVKPGQTAVDIDFDPPPDAGSTTTTAATTTAHTTTAHTTTAASTTASSAASTSASSSEASSTASSASSTAASGGGAGGADGGADGG